MGVQVIPIPTEVVSHSPPFPFPILCFLPIPMGFPWDSRSHWESHSHVHLCYAVAVVNGVLWVVAWCRNRWVVAMLSANDGRDVYHVRLILIFYIVHVLQCNEYNLYTELRVNWTPRDVSERRIIRGGGGGFNLGLVSLTFVIINLCRKLSPARITRMKNTQRD